MRFIDKSNRLLDWDNYIQDSNPTRWDSSSRSNRLKLHQHLHSQQNGLCIYCEQKVPKPAAKNIQTAILASHIEHILNKSDALFVLWMFEQDNLAMSCNGFIIGDKELDERGRVKTLQDEGLAHEFCGHPKDNLMNIDLFIDPFLYRDTHKYFTFDFDCVIKPSSKEPTKANYTIELLKLNHPILVARRLIIYETLIEDIENKALNISAHIAQFPEFYSMIRNLWGIA